MEQYEVNGRHYLRNAWNPGDIGYILGKAKVKIIKAPKKSNKVLVQYENDTTRKKAGSQTWVKRRIVSKKEY
jgi:hypothetical protein